MQNCFQLGGIFLKVISFGAHSLWPFWDRALDQYRVQKNEEKTSVLCVRNAFEEENDSDWKYIRDLAQGFFTIKVYLNHEGSLRLDYVRTKKLTVYICLHMNSDYSEIYLQKDISQTGGMMAFSMLGHLIPYVMLKHVAITFHAVLMEHANRGIIISAPSGTGKTTHARLWRDHKRALIINGDRATCSIEDGRWTGFGLPWCGTSGESINRDVPLTAFVVLEQAEENSVERLEGLDAFGVVMQNLLYPSWDRELTEKALDLVSDFLEKIPVFRLRCRPDLEAVEMLERALQEL